MVESLKKLKTKKVSTQVPAQEIKCIPMVQIPEQISHIMSASDFAANRTTILINSLNTDRHKRDKCDYCKAKRIAEPDYEKQKDKEFGNLKFYMSGFTSGKMRIDDFERLLNMGYTRTGNYFYHRNLITSCCEVYQYRVDSTKFQMNSQQKRVMKRFYKYLLFGKDAFQERPSTAQRQKMQEPENQYLQKIKIQIINQLKFLQHDQQQLILPKLRVYINKKLVCLCSNLPKLLSLANVDQQLVTNLQNNLTRIYLAEGFKMEYTQDYMNLFKSLQEMQILFPDEFIESKIDKQIMSGTKTSGFFNQTAKSGGFGASQNEFNLDDEDEDIEEEIYGQETVDMSGIEEVKHEVDSKKYNEKSKNYFTNYVKPYLPFNEEQVKPKHVYTISLHKPKFTQELMNLSVRYEKAVHKREQDQNNVQIYLCDIPTYNPQNQAEAQFPSYPDTMKLDRHREFKEEGECVNPGPGSYHMYHRIDGRLVAVGVIDICPSQVVNSAYFMWDPDFKFLNLGTVGALIELEYMRMLRMKYKLTNLKWYHLGELNINCPKVNYKLNYQPGYVICPYTKKLVDYELAKPKMLEIQNMSMTQKKAQLEKIKLNPDPLSKPPFDMIIDEDQLDLVYMQKVHNQGSKEEQSISNIFTNQKGIELNIVNSLICLLKAVGFTIYSSFVYEYKSAAEEES